ncbi:MAG: tetratricopeptide repeat protein, partial [Planctomycetota bacterium]
EDVDAHRELARICVDGGEAVQATVLMGGLAAIHVARGELDEAIVALRDTLELDPKCVEAQVQLATTLAQSGRNDEAVTEYESLAESMSEQTALGESMNWQFLIDIYEKIVNLDPAHVRARQWLAKAYQRKAQSDKEVANAEALLEALRRAGRTSELAEALKRFSELRPDEFPVREELARVLASLDRVPEAAKVLGDAIDHALKGRHFGAARRTAEQLVAIAPFDLAAHATLGRVAVLEKKDVRAFQHYRDLARLQQIAGRYPAAVDTCRKALELRNDAELRRLLAEVLILGGNESEAAREMCEAGRIELADENFGRAKWAAEEACRLDPDLSEASDLLYRVESRRTATRAGQSRPAWADRMPQKPSITGGSADVSIIDRPQRKYGSVTNVADKLRATKISGGAGFGTLSGEQAETTVVKGTSKGALARLKAIQGGGLAAAAAAGAAAAESGGGKSTSGPATPAGGWQPVASSSAKKSMSAAARLKALTGKGEDKESGPKGYAKAKGSKKALGAIARLKALSASGGAPSSSGVGATPSEAIKAAGPIESGDELKPAAGGKKALGAIARLKALGGGGAAAAAAAPAEEPIASIEDHLEYQPAEPGQTSTAIKRLRALSGSSDGEQDDDEPLVHAPSPAPAPAKGGKKALSAIARLKALSGGGLVKNAVTSGEATPEKTGGYQKSTGGKKALGAIARLKALSGKSTPDPVSSGATIGPMPGKIDEGGDYKKSTGGKKAVSAAARLKALAASKAGALPVPSPAPAPAPAGSDSASHAGAVADAS